MRMDHFQIYLKYFKNIFFYYSREFVEQLKLIFGDDELYISIKSTKKLVQNVTSKKI
jgi:hypothetical protein